MVLFNTVIKLLFSTGIKEHLKIRKEQISKMYREHNCPREKHFKKSIIIKRKLAVIEKYMLIAFMYISIITSYKIYQKKSHKRKEK